MVRILITGIRIKITIKCFLNNKRTEGKTWFWKSSSILFPKIFHFFTLPCQVRKTKLCRSIFMIFSFMIGDRNEIFSWYSHPGNVELSSEEAEYLEKDPIRPNKLFFLFVNKGFPYVIRRSDEKCWKLAGEISGAQHAPRRPSNPIRYASPKASKNSTHLKIDSVHKAWC